MFKILSVLNATVLFCLWGITALSQSGPKQLIAKFKQTTRYQVDASKSLITIDGHPGLAVFDKITGVKALLPKARLQQAAFKQSQLIDGIHFLTLSEDADLAVEKARLENTGYFEYVEMDGIGSAGATPNDQFYAAPQNYQWALKNNGVFEAGAKVGADINMEPTWDLTTGSPSLLVCVLDAGMKFDQPEFAGRLWTNPGEIAGNGIDDDGNGLTDDVNGWDWANNDNNPADDNNHGLGVTGVWAATGNNGIGIAGVDWQCKIMTGKIIKSDLFGFYSWWIAGITYAVNKGAKVINMSVGGTDVSQALKNACDFAAANNVIIVACMQNFNNSNVNYPAGYASTIAVGATNSADNRAVPFPWSATSGSNYGSHNDVVAPGLSIPGPGKGSNTEYFLYSGTSFATPLVSGVVSLMLGVRPNLTFTQVRDILRTTAKDQVGNPAEDVLGFDPYFGYGRVNALAALSQALPLKWLSISVQRLGNGAALQWKTAEETGTSHFEVERSLDGERFVGIGKVAAVNRAGIHLYKFTDDTRLPAGTVFYRVRQADLDGGFVYSRTVSLNTQAASQNPFVIWPNPVKNRLNLAISSFEGSAIVQVLNAAGKVLLQVPVPENGSSSISTQFLPAGFYHLVLTTKQGQYRQKFIKE